MSAQNYYRTQTRIPAIVDCTLKNEDYVQKRLSQLKLARNPKLMAFKIMLLMGE